MHACMLACMHKNLCKQCNSAIWTKGGNIKKNSFWAKETEGDFVDEYLVKDNYKMEIFCFLMYFVS